MLHSSRYWPTRLWLILDCMKIGCIKIVFNKTKMPSVLQLVFHFSLTNLWHNNIYGTLSSAFELAGMTPASCYAWGEVQCTRPMLLNCAVILLSCEVWMSSKVTVRSKVKVRRVARWLDLVSGDTSHWWIWVSCFSL